MFFSRQCWCLSGLDPQLLQTVNPNMTMTMTHESPEDTTTTAMKDEDIDISDPVDLSIPQHQPMIITTTTTSGLSCDNSTTLLRQPTIIVATSSPGFGGPPDLQLRQLTYSTQSDDSILLTSVKQELLDNISVTSSPDLSGKRTSLFGIVTLALYINFLLGLYSCFLFLMCPYHFKMPFFYCLSNNDVTVDGPFYPMKCAHEFR